MKNLAFIQKSLISSLLFTLKVAKMLNVGVATLPDLIKIRLNTNEDDSLAWNRWITPLTTLYLGVYKGKRIIVVAHHLGPLSTKERILKWSNSGTKDAGSDREKYGQAGLPKITHKEFRDLVEGKYGEVAIIDFESYYHGFLSCINGDHIIMSDALIDPLLKELLGSEVEMFIEKHFQVSRDYAIAERKEAGAEKKILKLEIKDRYGWNLFSETKCDFPDKNPIGLFLTLGCPSHFSNRDLSVSTEIRVNESLNYGRFVVLNDPMADILDINFDPTKHWKKCLRKFKGLVPDFFCLIKRGNKYFTEYPKKGNRLDTGEAMFEVLEWKKIGGQIFFETPTYGSPFLKYHIDEVKAIAPAGANAYTICGEVDPAEIAKVPVQFFKVRVITESRILSEKEVMSSLSLLMRINNIAV